MVVHRSSTLGEITAISVGNHMDGSAIWGKLHKAKPSAKLLSCDATLLTHYTTTHTLWDRKVFVIVKCSL